MKQLKNLILASQSPRRSEILKKAGYQFVPFPVHVSEIPDKNLSLNEQILDIARQKSDAVVRKIQAKGLALKDSVILCADTMVCIDAEALGKPENAEMATKYLRLLSGNQHEVKTAVYLLDLNTNESVTHIETTSVFFRTLSNSDISEYIATKEPFDKAGGYAIQGIGGKFVEKFEGDFDNVVGLPLQALEKLFKLKEWDFLKTPKDL